MISFVVLRNGQHLGSGGVQEGVLTAMVTRVTERKGRREEELTFTLSGLETSAPQQEHLDWISLEDLRLGDEFTIRVQDGPGDPPTSRRPGVQEEPAPDGSQQVKCSFSERFRSEKGFVAGADVMICLACRVLAAELLERNATSVFHLAIRQGAPCSFCYRPDRTLTIVAGAVGMCAECVAAIPLGT